MTKSQTFSSFVTAICNHFSDHFYAKNIDIFNYCQPTPLEEPNLVHINQSLCEDLNLNPDIFKSKRALKLMSADTSNTNLRPTSVVYSGHQFGTWAGQLGDGRAITLGEIPVKNHSAKREVLWDIQLKGAGLTPYSRFADGRAVLRSTIREYLCSEAMHGLRIPTTRALCLVSSNTQVQREKSEAAAILCRVAPNHIRFGSLEHFHYLNDFDSVRQLLDYIINRHFPDWDSQEDRYEKLFKSIVISTAYLIAQWQSVGFCHGVLNTDNMCILGQTLDYGPFGFLDRYDPQWICNTSDYNGRYSFYNQPSIGLWNLNALAICFSSLLSREKIISILKLYEPTLITKYQKIMSNKLGIKYKKSNHKLVDDLLKILQKNQVDYTFFFRQLSYTQSLSDELLRLFKEKETIKIWFKNYQSLLNQEKSSKVPNISMLKVNPKFTLRNHIAQKAITKAERGDFSELKTIETLIQSPFDEHQNYYNYSLPLPDELHSERLSCSS